MFVHIIIPIKDSEQTCISLLQQYSIDQKRCSKHQFLTLFIIN